jgi:diguanylate cyclase (GGDEF)-like protein
MQDKAYDGFSDFIVDNRGRINRYLNFTLWFFVVTGPAIALGVKLGIFPDISYATCASISLVVVAMSSIHLFLLGKYPSARFTSLFALTALDVLIVYMSLDHVSIHLTWFLVPLLSVLFCEMPTFLYALVLNYVLMLGTTWATAPYYFGYRTNYLSASAYFLDVIGGYTIETFIMGISAFIVVTLATQHYRDLFSQNELIREKEQSVEEEMAILGSMAEIYDNVNLISFVDNTEMSLRDRNQKKVSIDMSSQTHTLMNQRIKDTVAPDHLEAFLTFTNITTVRDRLTNKKIISGEFIDMVAGWFRAQYITVEAAPDGRPNTVIYTTRNVDEEKRREEHLIRLSMTDEMTRLYNRRRYEEDLASCRSEQLSEDFVLFSVDVNGLKTVNDTKGHAAGDELIKGAADCLALTMRQWGKVYRTGGDEFMAIVHADEPEQIREAIEERAAQWRGKFSDELSMSVGYAALRDHPDATVDDLERIADNAMYAKKARYYQQKGIDRRRR